MSKGEGEMIVSNEMNSHRSKNTNNASSGNVSALKIGSTSTGGMGSNGKIKNSISVV
jgi:hypothetical protein